MPRCVVVTCGWCGVPNAPFRVVTDGEERARELLLCGRGRKRYMECATTPGAQ